MKITIKITIYNVVVYFLCVLIASNIGHKSALNTALTYASFSVLYFFASLIFSIRYYSSKRLATMTREEALQRANAYQLSALIVGIIGFSYCTLIA